MRQTSVMNLPATSDEPTCVRVCVCVCAWCVCACVCAWCVRVCSKSFGNFDRVVGLGWLLADAVGCRQVSRAAAHALGLKARKLAATIKEKVRNQRLTIQRVAGKLELADPRRTELQKELEGVEEHVLHAPAELQFPEAGTAEQIPASGTRKRAREAEQEEPSHDKLIADAEAELLAAEKAAKKASAEVDRSEVKVVQAQKIADRILNKIGTATSKQARTLL